MHPAERQYLGSNWSELWFSRFQPLMRLCMLPAHSDRKNPGILDDGILQRAHLSVQTVKIDTLTSE